SMRNDKDNTFMELEGQGIPSVRGVDAGRLGQPHPELDDRGFAMVVLLIGLAVMAVWMSVLLPTWKHQSTREKEEELVFRGEQYARAITLFARKNGGSLPQDIDVLVSQKYLRRKWIDPVTGKDFVPLMAGASSPGGSTPGRNGTPGQN